MDLRIKLKADVGRARQADILPYQVELDYGLPRGALVPEMSWREGKLKV